MHLGMLLDMIGDGMADRALIGSSRDGLTGAALRGRASAAADLLSSMPGDRIAMIDVNSVAVPVALFGSALAGKPFVPLNYRLTDDRLRALVERTAPAIVIGSQQARQRVGDIEGVNWLSRDEFLDATSLADPSKPTSIPDIDPDSVAVLLYTSGTTGDPKAAVLRHSNLASYILSTVEYAAAGPEEAALVSVPPYHVAGISAVLSSTFIGRRISYLESFDPVDWVSHVEQERVTHAMVVPTMLNRILDVVEDRPHGLESLRSLSYGGGPMPLPVIERALKLLPHAGFVNAYGLTETSSTVALLGPDDHREAWTSTDPAIRARLSSVGRPVPSISVTIRDPEGRELPAGEIGEVWVRGDQVSGRYVGDESDVPAEWFHTKDSGHLDEAGYLYVHGRLDDVIVRGGENLSPGEIESVLVAHPAIAEAAVVGIPDNEWGEKVVAAVVLVENETVPDEELKQFVQSRLRSTMTPEHIHVRDELPFNETGKLLRRVLRDELTEMFGPTAAT